MTRFVVAAMACLVAAVGPTAAAAHASPTQLLSAFFGADQQPWFGALCPKGVASDGMPVVVTDRVDAASLSSADFAVISADGAHHQPVCATLAPADEAGELRTVLLVGQFGDGAANPPVRVEVVGSVTTLDGTADYQGASIHTVIPLDAGPSMITADVLPGTTADTEPPQESRGCPTGTRQTIRVAWAGGVTPVAGGRTTPAHARAYRVELEDGGTTRPFWLGDRNDGDNYHELCLATTARPVAVTVAANAFVDPIGDPNAAGRLDL